MELSINSDSTRLRQSRILPKITPSIRTRLGLTLQTFMMDLCLLFRGVPQLRTTPSTRIRKRECGSRRYWGLRQSSPAPATQILPQIRGAVLIPPNVILRPPSVPARVQVVSRPLAMRGLPSTNKIEGNTVYGPFTDMGIASAGWKTTIFGNVVGVEQGHSAFGPVTSGGIALFGQSYGNTANPDWGATVTRNTVSNVWPALSLAIRATTQQLPNEGFTARIGLNDFLTVYKTVNGTRVPNPAVQVLTQSPVQMQPPPDYFISTDISINFSETIPFARKPVTITGNFWGLDCPDSFFSSGSTPTSVLVIGNLASGVKVDDSHALSDTVLRTITFFEMPSQGPRCPQAITWNRPVRRF